MKPRFDQRVNLNTAAELLDISTKTLRKYIAAGELPANRVGRRIIVKLADLEALASRNKWEDLN